MRAQLPCLSTAVYLNTGRPRPLPRPVADALPAWAPGRPRAGTRQPPPGSGARRPRGSRCATRWGGCVGAGGDRIALTANTTEGLNVAAWGLDLRPGDEIVMPALEYPGVAVLVATVARRRGAVLRLIDPDGGERGPRGGRGEP